MNSRTKWLCPLTLGGALLALPLLGIPGLAQGEPAEDANISWQEALDLAPDEVPAHVVRILRTSNKAQINRYVGKVYNFERVNPGQINNFFHSALLREEGAAYTFVGPDGASGKIMVVCPAYQIPYFDKLAQELDRTDLTSAPGSTYVYRQLKHRSAFDGDFLGISSQYATANSVVRGDVSTNALFIFDSPSGADYLTEALDLFLDQPTPVVKIKVKLYEVDVNNDGTIGLDYEDFKNGVGQNLIIGTLTHSELSAQQDSGPGPWGDIERTTRSHGSLIDIQYPSSYFDFLVQKGNARVMTETALVSSSSRGAYLFTGDQVLFYAKNSYNNDPSYSRTVTGTAAPRQIEAEVPGGLHSAGGVLIQALDAGVSLDVVPIIGEEHIRLEIETSVVSISGYADDGSPIMNSRRAKTTVSARDGEEIVLGGMTRERQGGSNYKMPILGNLPVLGWAFGGETQTSKKSMIVMVLQPEIDMDFSNLTEKEQQVIAVSTGSAPPDIPDPIAGFDMFLFDGGN